jgi:3-hydroxyacyl-[acyl-carrier-protein] dehydratase
MNDIITSEFVVPANHPSLAGHFPGRPVVPAVVLLDAVLAASREALRASGNLALRSIPVAKFLQPVLADQRIELRARFAVIGAAQWRASFEGWRAAALVFEGAFILSATDVKP